MVSSSHRLRGKGRKDFTQRCTEKRGKKTKRDTKRKTKRDSSTAQADHFTGVKWKEKASACSARNDRSGWRSGWRRTPGGHVLTPWRGSWWRGETSAAVPPANEGKKAGKGKTHPCVNQRRKGWGTLRVPLICERATRLQRDRLVEVRGGQIKPGSFATLRMTIVSSGGSATAAVPPANEGKKPERKRKTHPRMNQTREDGAPSVLFRLVLGPLAD